MQKAFARLTALLLAVILLAGALTACGEKIEGSNYIEINGEKIPIPYAMKVGGEEVSMEAYRYYFLMLKTNYFDYGDESYWTQNPDDEENLKTYTATYCQMDAGYKLLAEKYGLSLGEEELALIDKQIEQYRTSYDSDEAFQEALAEQYLTEELYRELLQPAYLREKIVDHLFGEGGEMALDDEDAYIAENYVHVQHILIKDKATAEDVLSRAKGGEDFVSLMKEYNEDTGETEDGYTFTTGEMVAEFENTSFALEENAISELVKTTYGYHIIKRLPLDESYLEENKEDMLNTYYTGKVGEILDEYMNQLVEDDGIEYSSYYEQFGIDTILPPETEK